MTVSHSRKLPKPMTQSIEIQLHDLYTTTERLENKIDRLAELVKDMAKTSALAAIAVQDLITTIAEVSDIPSSDSPFNLLATPESKAPMTPPYTPVPNAGSITWVELVDYMTYLASESESYKFRLAVVEVENNALKMTITRLSETVQKLQITTDGGGYFAP